MNPMSSNCWLSLNRTESDPYNVKLGLCCNFSVMERYSVASSQCSFLRFLRDCLIESWYIFKMKYGSFNTEKLHTSNKMLSY